MDISDFMAWFLNQVLNMFTWIFNILDNIKFLGTSLLDLIITITVLSFLIPVILTLGKSNPIRSERVKTSKERTKNNEE